MRVHQGLNFGSFQPNGMDMGHTFDPQRVVARARAVVTNAESVSVRRQIIETAIVLACATELAAIFLAFGW